MLIEKYQDKLKGPAVSSRLSNSWGKFRIIITYLFFYQQQMFWQNSFMPYIIFMLLLHFYMFSTWLVPFHLVSFFVWITWPASIGYLVYTRYIPWLSGHVTGTEQTHKCFRRYTPVIWTKWSWDGYILGIFQVYTIYILLDWNIPDIYHIYFRYIRCIPFELEYTRYILGKLL